VASFDRAIPPGGEGRIALTVNTKGYQGDIYETAEVYTNDPEMAEFTLGVRMFVQVPVFLSPRVVYFRGKAGEPVTKAVKIEAGLERPLTVHPDKFSLNGILDYEVEEVEAGRSFMVLFTTVSDRPGDFSGFLNTTANDFSRQP